MAAKVYPLIAQGVFATFGYFIVDGKTGHALLIDPGSQPELFESVVEEQDWLVEKILLTHGHFDHMGAADALRNSWDAPIYAHRLSPRYLEDPYLNLSASHGLDITLEGTEPLKEGDAIAISTDDSISLQVSHVPGHTEDSVAYVLFDSGLAFVGDTVYEGGPGLTIFPTGNSDELRRSIEQKILTLPKSTQLLSGHSEPITVESLSYRM